jgi:tetratricopeptide (TPR) repeat protein
VPAEELPARLDRWLVGIDGDHRSFALDVRTLLRPAPGVELDSGLELRVAMELVARAASRRPVVLWLDDLQWGGAEATSLVRAVLERPTPFPVCVLASVRSDEPAPPGYEALLESDRVTRVSLDRLDVDAARRFVEQLLEIDPVLSDQLARRAEGNPLFLVQLVSQLVETKALERSEGRYRLAVGVAVDEVPPTIEDLWSIRVARAIASADGRRALRTLALLGDRLSRPLRAALATRILGVEEAARAALAAGLCSERDGVLQWAHGLLREHLVRAIPVEERALAHRACADALAALGNDELLGERARHLHAAGEVEDAVACLWRAGSTWLDRGRFEESRAWFEDLLRWLDDCPPSASREGRRASALAELGRIAYMRGALGESAALLALAEARAGSSAEALSLVARRSAYLVHFSGDYPAAIAGFERAVAIARDAGDGIGEAESTYGLSQVLGLTGRLADAKEQAIRSLSLYRVAEQPARTARVLRSLAQWQLADGESDEAARHIDEAESLSERSGDAYGVAMGRFLRAQLLDERGEREAARRSFEESVRVFERLGLAPNSAVVHLNLASLALSDGDLAGAANEIAIAERAGIGRGQPEVAYLYYRAELAEDDLEAQERLAEAVLAQRKAGTVHRHFARSAARGAARASGALREAFLAEEAHLRQALARG